MRTQVSSTPQTHIKLGTIVHTYIPGDPMGRQRQKKSLSTYTPGSLAYLAETTDPISKTRLKKVESKF